MNEIGPGITICFYFAAGVAALVILMLAILMPIFVYQNRNTLRKMEEKQNHIANELKRLIQLCEQQNKD